MSIQFIPLSQIPNQTAHVVLDDQNCTVTVRWMQNRLYMDLSVDSIDICTGAICQSGPEIVQAPNPNFLGTLHFLDLEGEEPPRWDGLYNGTTGRWAFLYASDGEDLPDCLLY